MACDVVKGVALNLGGVVLLAVLGTRLTFFSDIDPIHLMTSLIY